MRVTVLGAGVAGLVCALELARRGADVEVLERSNQLGRDSCAWVAGGMLAPWCELESAEPIVAQWGVEGIAWWRERFAETVQRGSLVVAHARDANELTRFARHTRNWEWLGRERIFELEPDIVDRFDKALFFADEAHLDPRAALAALARQLAIAGVTIRYGVDAASADIDCDRIVDCRGLAARDVLHDLRGVKGEMVLLRSREVALTSAVRILHPRFPLYIVPRADGLFMVGATAIESDEPNQVSARSLVELLSTAYALHPAFGDADVVEIATGVRPAFPDNLPRLRWRGDVLYVNGLYRHGFLLAPSLARMAADAVLHDRWFPEVMDEDRRERRCS